DVPHVLDQRVEHDLEAGDVGLDPAGPVDDRHLPAIIITGKSGYRSYRLSDGRSLLAELGHHPPNLGEADLRAGPDPPGRRRCGHVPVDHLGAAHPYTVRGRDSSVSRSRIQRGRWPAEPA